MILNASFTDYLLPTTLDMPPVEIDLVEEPEPDAPYGVKGVGEPPTVVSTAAIVSAMRAATGRPLTRVPVRPDDICLLIVGEPMVPPRAPSFSRRYPAGGRSASRPAKPASGRIGAERRRPAHRCAATTTFAKP